MSNKQTQKQDKSDKVLLPYFTKPLTYFLIGLVIVLPIAFGLLHAAVTVVHRAQPHFAKTQYEIQLNDAAYTSSDAASGRATIPTLAAGDKLGTLCCVDKGLNTDVYYGGNRVSYRGGVGLSSQSALPGQGAEINIKGYAAGAFKALANLEEADMITLATSWGVYQYEVINAAVAEKPATADGEQLVLSCAKSKNAFANFDDEKLYVIARYLSGPSAEEVAQ